MKREDSISHCWAGVAVPSGAAEILTNPTHIHANEGIVRVGVDSSGCKHLLVPCGADTFRQDRRSRGVALVQQALIVDGAKTTFADLVCVEKSLEAAFLELVDDISRRINERPAEAIAVLQRTLRSGVISFGTRGAK